jgi:hypothetical protein
MNFTTLQVTVMAGAKGDIFWDLAPYIVYAPGFDIGCNIYVANPSDTAREYALMARLSRDTTKISEEALPVFGYTWFTVEPHDFIVLKGALRFNESNADLTVSLIERETEEVADAVATRLIAPSTSALPPAWPGATTTTTDWTAMLGMMMPVLMMGMFGMVMVSAFRKKEEEKEPVVAITEEKRKLLPPGRAD